MVPALAFAGALFSAGAVYALESEFQKAVDLVRRGIALGNPQLIGKAATISALANQRILYKPELPAIMDFAASVGAVGVNVAHSGTVVGILLDARRHQEEEVLTRVRQSLGWLEARCLRLIGWGIRVG